MQFGPETLLLIPCCAEKRAGTDAYIKAGISMADYLGWQNYITLLSARKKLLSTCREITKYSSGKYAKNQKIVVGPDFGGEEISGSYLPALQRYTGSLYKSDKDWSEKVQSAMQSVNSPRLLIISALYGLLHPLELIQDYNLQMSDQPAKNIWNQYMPQLLGHYIERMKVRRVVMYFGSSTTYLKVAAEAVKPLLKSGKLNEVLQYDVENGNAYHTPHNHGLVLLRDFTGQDISKYTRPVNLRKLRSI